MAKLYRLLILTVCFSTWSFGCLTADSAHVRLNQDESRILVIYVPGSAQPPALSSGEAIDAQRFPDSGVYDFESGKKLYAINWYSRDEEVLSTPDLMLLARIDRIGQDWALRFYDQGKCIESYSRRELLHRYSHVRYLPWSHCDYYSEWLQNVEIEGTQLTLRTAKREFRMRSLGYQETHVFDMRSGRLVSTTIYDQKVLPRLLIYGLAALTLATVLVIRSLKRA